MIKTPIHEFLQNYCKGGLLRCHMPGGKGKIFSSDITEIYGADSLYDSAGIIAESEGIAGSLYGSGVTLYSCSGSTLAIFAMLALNKIQGGRIAAGRYSHRSFIDAAVLLDFEVEWLYPSEYLSAVIEPDTLVKSGSSVFFLTSVDYYGGECDIKSAAEICGRDKAVLVDNAHGAYKVFTGEHPIINGAAFSADSAHKTLPVLTGGAYLHVADSGLRAEAKEAMALFGTSSPSYLILESLDLCNRHIAAEKDKAHKSFGLVEALKENLSALGFSLRKSDRLRVVVDARECGYSGIELGALLRERGLECEMCDDTYSVLLFSTITSEADITSIIGIFKDLPVKKRLPGKDYVILRPQTAASPREAYFSRRERVSLYGAMGRISGGIIAPCPPGIPLVMPGERLSGLELEVLSECGVKDILVCC